MNKFAEYCGQLLAAEGSNLYRFCTVHNLERTGIRRMLSGERIPKEDLFLSFERALTLTPDETKRLHELYECEKIGEKRFKNRIFIKDMLEYIGELQSLHENRVRIHQENFSIDHFENEKVVGSHTELLFYIRQIIRGEQTALYSNLPIINTDISQILNQEFCQGQKKAIFYHLLTILKKSGIYTDVNYNLKLLKYVLSLAMYQQNQYCPMYCYGDSVAMQQGFHLYPYFLYSSACILLLSSNLDSGIMITNSSTLKVYYAEIMKQVQMAKPFIIKTQSMEEMVECYYKKCVAVSDVSYVFDYYPCVLEAYSTNRFYPFLKKDIENCADLIQLMDSTISRITEIGSYTCFLPMEGLLHFARTGEIGHQLASILYPFSKTVRKEILKILADKCQEGKIQLHIMPDQFLHPFPKITLELYKNRRIVVLSHDTNSAFCYLDENTIYDALQDYFESLLEKPEVLSVEETIRKLEEVGRMIE